MNVINKGTRKDSLRCAAAVGALIIASPALAQESGPAQQVEEVVITGSRLIRRDYVSTSPIATVGSEQFALQPTGTPEALLNTLPQIAPDIGASSTDQRRGGGGSNINLRGLGPRRNLVLINGRRMIGADSGGAVDVSMIPTALIDRVEIITGGASAVYGADAVAGVVNFILKDRIPGPMIEAQYGITDRGDGEEISATATIGGRFAEGRGNAVLSYNYYDRDEIRQSDRAFSRASEYPTNTPWGAYNPVGNLPSQAAVNALFASYGFAPGSVLASDQLGINADASLFSLSISAVAPPVTNFRGSLSDPEVATHFFPGRFAYQYSPQTGLVTPLKRHSIYASADYDLTENVNAFGQLLFSQYEMTVNQGLATGATTLQGGAFDVPVTNPFLPADLRTLLASRPNPNATFRFQTRIRPLGIREEVNDNSAFQLVGGLRGKLGETWRWEAFVTHGETNNTTQRNNGGSFRAIQALLSAPDGGVSACAGGLNLFGPQQVISSQCMALINPSSITKTELSADIVEASITGEPMQLPAGPLAVAFGVQHRSESFEFAPDVMIRTGDLGGFIASPPVKGSFDNTDLFAEVRVPILRDLPFVKLAALSGGYRRSDHSVVGGFSTYKVDGEWHVTDQLRLRGSYQRAVRAPSIGELFAPVSTANIVVTDPCNVTSPQRTGPDAGRVRALCIAQGVPENIVDTYTQPTAAIIARTGGNIDLKEETADTYTAGVVVSSPFENPWVSDLILSVDYFNIKLTDAISSLQASSFIPRCYNTRGDNPTYSPTNSFCQLFERRFDGGIHQAMQNSINVASLHVSGVDAQLRWRPPLPDTMGQLAIDLAVSWMERFDRRESPSDRVLDYTGTIGQFMGDTLPEWKGTLTATYDYGNVTAMSRLRYIDAMSNRVNVTTPGAGTNVPATWYLDLTGIYRINEKVSIRAGVINVFDQQPRLYTPQQQSRTDPSTYDVLGRRFLFAVSAAF